MHPEISTILTDIWGTHMYTYICICTDLQAHICMHRTYCSESFISVSFQLFCTMHSVRKSNTGVPCTSVECKKQQAGANTFYNWWTLGGTLAGSAMEPNVHYSCYWPCTVAYGAIHLWRPHGEGWRGSGSGGRLWTGRGQRHVDVHTENV